jgi:hypothetical protein
MQAAARGRLMQKGVEFDTFKAGAKKGDCPVKETAPLKYIRAPRGGYPALPDGSGAANDAEAMR